jgi:hypothetical protein
MINKEIHTVICPKQKKALQTNVKPPGSSPDYRQDNGWST